MLINQFGRSRDISVDLATLDCPLLPALSWRELAKCRQTRQETMRYFRLFGRIMEDYIPIIFFI